MRTSELKGGVMLRFHRNSYFSLTIVFFYEYARGRYALNGHVTFSGLAYFISPLPYHVPPAHVLICSRSRLMRFLLLVPMYRYG